jgi:ATP-dependent RNA helicase MSS116, mitochondrial
LALLPNHHYISTVAEAEESTHEHVAQTYSLVPRASHFATVSTYISVHASAQHKAKVIVFLATAREAALYGTLFDTLSSDTGLPAFQIHSRLSQSARTRATDGFKNAERAVMFASDVIARGIDISGITSVVQVGVPANAEQCASKTMLTWRS